MYTKLDVDSKTSTFSAADKVSLGTGHTGVSCTAHPSPTSSLRYKTSHLQTTIHTKLALHRQILAHSQ